MKSNKHLTKPKNRIANLFKRPSSPINDVKDKLLMFSDYVRIKHAKKLSANKYNKGYTFSISRDAEQAASDEFYAYRDSAYEEHRMKSSDTNQK